MDKQKSFGFILDRNDVTLTDGSQVTNDHRKIDPKTGQQKGYVVLSEEERAKGFVRPVRSGYIHVGPKKPSYHLRALTDEENERYKDFHYMYYEEYPEDIVNERGVVGKYWTTEELSRSGCGTTTHMGRALAETYARDPEFYSGTFCVKCKHHYPLSEFVWEDGTALRT